MNSMIKRLLLSFIISAVVVALSVLFPKWMVLIIGVIGLTAIIYMALWLLEDD